MSFLSLLPALTLILREPAFILIALAQAALVFFLCLASKSRLGSILIGVGGAIVVLMVGNNRYGWLDVLFVAAAVAVAIRNLAPPEADASQEKPSASAVQAAGGAALVIVCVFGGLWLYVKMGSQPIPFPVVNHAPSPGSAVAQPAPSRGFGSEAITVVSEETRLEKLARANAEAEALLRGTAFQRGEGSASADASARVARRGAPNDKRHCLDLRDNAAVARCVGE